MTDTHLDRIRLDTLDQISRSERLFWWLLVMAGIFEAAFLITYLLVMDFDNRLHWLILIAAGLVYLTTGFWTWALAAHATSRSWRLLKAIDLLHERLGSQTQA